MLVEADILRLCVRESLDYMRERERERERETERQRQRERQRDVYVRLTVKGL